MFEILFEHNSKAFNYILSPYILCCLLAYTCDSKSHSSTFSMPFNRCIKVYWAYNEETSYKLEISMEKKWHEHFQWSQLINIQRRSLISSAVVFDIIRLDRFMFSYKEPRLIFFFSSQWNFVEAFLSLWHTIVSSINILCNELLDFNRTSKCFVTKSFG